MAFPLYNCSSCSKPAADFCFTCDRQLCKQHASKPYHNCPTEGDDYTEAYTKTCNNKFTAFLSSIDPDGMLNNAIKAAKVPLETIQDCRLDVPASRETALMGGRHLHLPLTFKEGDKWVVRVALQDESASPHELLIQEVNSEIATLTALECASVRIAKVKSRCIVPKGAGPPYFYLEWLDGKAAFMEADLFQQKAWITEIAKEFIKLDNLSYDAIGSLTFDSEDGPGICIGPLVEPTLCGRDKYGRISQLGPFKNAGDFRIAQVQQVLDLIEGGFKYSDNAVDAYMIHLEVIDLIKVLYPTRQGPQLFYIKHADDKGDHWLVRDDLFVGTIDWEWAYTTTKEEAFSAPLAFIDIGAFYDGHNDLSELENTFAAAFDTLERPDLAAFVRNGKKYQRLPFVIGSDFIDLPNLFLVFRQLVLDEESKPTFEEWKRKAWKKYKRDPFLASKIMTARYEANVPGSPSSAGT